MLEETPSLRLQRLCGKHTLPASWREKPLYSFRTPNSTWSQPDEQKHSFAHCFCTAVIIIGYHIRENLPLLSCPPHSSQPSLPTLFTISLEVVRPALLLGPRLGIVTRGVVDELLFVRVDDLAAAVLALQTRLYQHVLFHAFVGLRTMEVGLGALTGRPLALTGARVPSLSAFLCSRAICKMSAPGTDSVG